MAFLFFGTNKVADFQLLIKHTKFLRNFIRDIHVADLQPVTIMAMPNKAMPAPIQSLELSITPSTHLNQISATTTYTPP